MFTSRLALATFAAAMLSIFAAPTANAAYAPPPFTAEVPKDVAPGEPFSITFESGNIDCNWTMRPFHGQKAPAGSGSSYTVSLIAPKGNGTYTVVARCEWDSAEANPAKAPASSTTSVTPAVFSSAAGATDSLLAVPQVDTYSAEVVVGDGTSTGDDGASSDTGGSNVTLLAAIGGALAIAGAGVAFAVRRRKVA